MTKTIAICGTGYGALALWLASILANLGENVLIHDNSTERIGSFLKIPEQIDPERDIYRFASCDYTQMECVPTSSHGIVISLCGNTGMQDACNLFIAVARESGESIEVIKDLRVPEAGESVLVVEDSMGLMSKEYRMLAKDMGIHVLTILKGSKRDRAAKLSFELNGQVEPKKTTKEMQSLMFALVRNILPDTEEKAFYRALRGSRKGARQCL